MQSRHWDGAGLFSPSATVWCVRTDRVPCLTRVQAPSLTSSMISLLFATMGCLLKQQRELSSRLEVSHPSLSCCECPGFPSRMKDGRMAEGAAQLPYVPPGTWRLMLLLQTLCMYCAYCLSTFLHWPGCALPTPAVFSGAVTTSRGHFFLACLPPECQPP